MEEVLTKKNIWNNPSKGCGYCNKRIRDWKLYCNQKCFDEYEVLQQIQFDEDEAFNAFYEDNESQCRDEEHDHNGFRRYIPENKKKRNLQAMQPTTPEVSE